MMVGKATKKPVEVDYFQWWGESSRKLLDEWCKSFNDVTEEHFLYNAQEKTLKVMTLEGSSYDVPLGYIIIRGVKGEYYPCELNIFLMTYNIK